MKLSKSIEVTIESNDLSPQQNNLDSNEEGVEVPLESISPDTLRNLIAEFVTREWPDTEYSLDTKIVQVLNQLRAGQAKIVFDLVSNTCNIMSCR
jgi:uncharacterized protein YheU (UPF0270 family)